MIELLSKKIKKIKDSIIKTSDKISNSNSNREILLIKNNNNIKNNTNRLVHKTSERVRNKIFMKGTKMFSNPKMLAYTNREKSLKNFQSNNNSNNKNYNKLMKELIKIQKPLDLSDVNYSESNTYRNGINLYCDNNELMRNKSNNLNKCNSHFNIEININNNKYQKNIINSKNLNGKLKINFNNYTNNYNYNYNINNQNNNSNITKNEKLQKINSQKILMGNPIKSTRTNFKGLHINGFEKLIIQKYNTRNISSPISVTDRLKQTNIYSTAAILTKNHLKNISKNKKSNLAKNNNTKMFSKKKY